MPDPHSVDVSNVEFVSLVTKLPSPLFKELHGVKGKTLRAGEPVEERAQGERCPWVRGRRLVENQI